MAVKSDLYTVNPTPNRYEVAALKIKHYNSVFPKAASDFIDSTTDCSEVLQLHDSHIQKFLFTTEVKEQGS